MKKFFLIAALIVAIFPPPAFSAETRDVQVKAEVDKAFLTIGDPVIYTVTIEHAPDVRVLSDIPAPPSDIFEIKKVEDIHEKKKKSEITGRRFILTSYRLGEFVLDPVTVRYIKDGQSEKSVQTNKLYLTVKSVAEGESKEDIRDVKTVVPYKLRPGKLLWVLFALALSGAAFAVYRAFRAKRGALHQPAPPPLTAEEEALQRLRELFESDLLRRGLIKLYFLRLSEILRVYFEKRYRVLAVESTTIEILRALRSLHLESGLYQKIQQVLEASDLAKFAKWVPSPQEILRLNTRAEEIVRESTPVPAPASPEVPHGV